MADDRSRRTHSIFMRALDLDTSAREAFVSNACADDADLKQRVQSLFTVMDRSTRFLESPALGTRATHGFAAPAPPPDAISVRGYRVIRVIGVGGMACVYEAMQEQPERTVALKVMSRALTNTSAVRRFRYETEVLARLQHPGIAQIFEAGTCDDGHGNPLPFFAMEMVAGARTITDHADERALSLHERLQLFAEVCDAVQHGHQVGVIHRDLKPANILVDASGRPRIIDFGVARSTDKDLAEMTRRADVGQLIGTLNFMSPEQCSGASDVDARTDVYSLGVILYQLIAGRLPHDLSAVSIPDAVRIITQEPPPRLGTLVLPARGDLDAIVMTAMEKDPSRRYNSAASLAADVRRFLNHKTIDARPPTVMHQARLFARRHRMVVVASAAALVTIIAASGVIAAFAYRATLESRRRFDAEQRAVKERDAACLQAYVASIAGAFASNQVGDFAQARRRLNAAPPYLHNWEWSLVSAMIERGEQTIRVHEGMVFAFAASPDARKIATGSRDGSLAVWDAETGRRLASMPGVADSPVFSVAFTPDQQHVISGSGDDAVRIWNATTGALVRVLGSHPGSVESVACSPSGLIASASLDGVAHLWNFDSTEPLVTFDDQPGGIQGVSFSTDGSLLITWNRRGSIWVRNADGSTIHHRLDFGGVLACVRTNPDDSIIAAGGADGTIRMWRADDATELPPLSTKPNISTVRALAFSPDSRWLASGQIDRTIRIWDMKSPGLHEIRLGHEEAISGLAFNPGGDRLYSSSWDRTVKIWPFGATATNGPSRQLQKHTDNVLAVAFSPDGSLIASAGRDDLIRLWDTTLGEELASLRGHKGNIQGIAFSPDGSTIASGSEDGTVRLWNTATAQEIGTVGTRAHSIWSVAFSPNGRSVASAGDDGVVRVADLHSRETILEFPAHTSRIYSVRYSPDGKILATSSRDGTVRLWEAATGTHRRTLKGHESDVYSVVFSLDGTRLYSGSRDQTVRVWKTESGEWVETLDSQGQLITSLSLSPDGTRLAAGSWFAEIVLWDLPSFELVASFQGHTSAIRSLAFSPDGSSIVCGGHDGLLSFYNTKPRPERVRDLERARTAKADAQESVERLSSSPENAESILDAIDREFRDDPETHRWARNLVLMRGAAPIPQTHTPK